MHNLDYLFTTKPHTVRAVFVSDLHLSAHSTRLNQAFVQLLHDLAALPNLQYLFILGDFLDAWIGDDVFFTQPNHWLHPIVEIVQKLSADVYIMHGNRDFMMGKKLCNAMRAKRIDAPYFWTYQHICYRLEHGDVLCTDDKAYQRYRAIIQNPISKSILSALPLCMRQKLAHNLKNQSLHQKTQKSSQIMDVNASAVQKALTTCDILVHGHTHRPATHTYAQKQRLVLGDWQVQSQSVQAVVGALSDTPDPKENALALYRFICTA